VHENTDRFGKLLDRIQQEHLTQPPTDWSNDEFHSLPDVARAKEFIHMLERFDGATLYALSNHPWQLTKCRLWENLYKFYDDDVCFMAYPFLDLVDGRCIAFTSNNACNPSRRCLFCLGTREVKFKDHILVARDIQELFELIFAAEGSYYFDDPNFVEAI
jgi:hypothetical protein